MAEKRKSNARTGGTTIDHNVGVSYGDLEKECNPFQLSQFTFSLLVEKMRLVLLLGSIG
jgi:hypothetical protein